MRNNNFIKAINSCSYVYQISKNIYRLCLIIDELIIIVNKNKILFSSVVHFDFRVITFAFEYCKEFILIINRKKEKKNS